MGLLAWQDHAVVAVYLAGVLGIGLWCSRKQTNEEEYFLGGRRLPWFAVGMSIIASLLSSLTYISEPAEVWKSGTSHLLGKMLAIPVEMLIVWVFIIPFLMRFRITSAYDYLDLRFGAAVRRFAVVLFLLTVVTWMGFIVLASSRVIADLSGMPLPAVLATVGLATTFYTVLGGLRAVVWTDVTQVLVLFGGALYVVGWVAWTTGSGLGDWHAALAASNVKSFQWFSANPMERATVLTVAINMCV